MNAPKFTQGVVEPGFEFTQGFLLFVFEITTESQEAAKIVQRERETSMCTLYPVFPVVT